MVVGDEDLGAEVCEALGRADSFEEERFARFAESATAEGGSISREQVTAFVAELLAGGDDFIEKKDMYANYRQNCAS